MATLVRDNILAVTIDGTGATHYRVAHDENLPTAEYVQLPIPNEGTSNLFLVRHDLPTVPGIYPVSVQIKNSLHESDVVSESVTLLSNIAAGVSTLRNKLRIAQVFGPNADPDTYCDDVHCFYGFISLYNNSLTDINLANVAIWTRYQNMTSTTLDGGLTWSTLPDDPATKSEWTKTVLSGTIGAGKYFLIQGPRPVEGHIVNEVGLTPAINFTAGVDDATNFHTDLDLSGSATFYISSKVSEVFLADASLAAVPSTIYNGGALCTGFIDLHGAGTTDLGTLAPECIYNYMTSNSKQQVKTIIDPTKEAMDNSLDYTTKSIKTATPALIRTLIWDTAKPRNSTYIKATV